MGSKFQDSDVNRAAPARSAAAPLERNARLAREPGATRYMETIMLQRTLITLGAVTVAGLAVLGFGRQLERWRRSNLNFEYPIEELFV